MTEEPDDVIHAPGTDRVFKRNRILIVVLAQLAMALMSISSINVALPSIENDIGASSTDIQWLLSGYALSFGIVLVAAGRLGDLLGRSSMFVIGLAVFVASSLGCTVIHDPSWLNVFRIAQGVGAGISGPQINGMIVQYFHGLKRARAFSLFGLTISVSVSIAPVLTGLFIQWFGQSVGWRASFAWNVIFGLGVIILAFRWLPFGVERGRRIARKRGEVVETKVDLDPIGMILLAIAVVCVMLPFIIKRPEWFALLAVGVVVGYAWVRWERRYKLAGHDPMVDLRLFKFASFTNATAISGVMFLGATSMYSVLALFTQNGLGASALVAGSLGIPGAIASAISSYWSGSRVLSKGRTIVVGSFAVFLVGLAGCIALAPFLDSISYWWLTVPLTVAGLGTGAINSSNQTLSQEEIPASIAGTAGAVKQVSERIGTAVGNAMVTAVLFALVSSGWIHAFSGAYAVVIVFVAISMVLAIIDLRTLHDPGFAA